MGCIHLHQAMPRLIRHRDNRNQPLVRPGDGLALSYFNLVRLHAGAVHREEANGCERLAVVLSGNAEIRAGDHSFADVGQRADVWSGKADSVYAGTGSFTLTANAEPTEIAIAGGVCGQSFPPFRIKPDEVDVVEVGSNETKSLRRIFHLLGQKQNGLAGNLLVSELYADEGCWSGYPPHKHDTERPPEETAFEEIYHYRFQPETGFGGQYCYDEGEEPRAVMTRQGDTFLVDRGYHPTSTSPGHRGYIFTILVGRHQRSLVQYFEPQHRHLMGRIPGLQAMRDKFK